MHALGIYHEQSRTDRDDYVTIELDNVDSGKNALRYIFTTVAYHNSFCKEERILKTGRPYSKCGNGTYEKIFVFTGEYAFCRCSVN